MDGQPTAELGDTTTTTETHLYPGLLTLLLQLGVDLGEELNRLPSLVRLPKVRAKIQLTLGDVVVVLEQIPVPQLERKNTQKKATTTTTVTTGARGQ